MKTVIQKSILITFILIGVVNFSNAQQNRNSILFFAVDNWVEVFVDGEMVFKQDSDAGHLKNEVDFDLNPFIQDLEDPLVEIKLINATCSTCDGGNGWTIEFEVFQDGESVDYIIEEGDSMGGDVVFSIEYEWGYI